MGNDGDSDGGSTYCISCGAAVGRDAAFCQACGVDQDELPTGGAEGRAADEKYCCSCGTVINRAAEQCPECGRRQTAGREEANVDRVTAAILAIVLGGFGAHKFYLGQTSTGVVYLCFFWTLIPAVLGFFEGFVYLTKSDEEFHRSLVAD